MAKKVYLQSAITWAIAIGLATAGAPTFLYFAYSNSIGSIEITQKSWTDFCNATSWNDKNICYAYLNFTAKEDTFWYPINADPYGRSTPYSFDPAVKEWKLERRWGNGWREIPLTRPCYYTWCGAKSNNAYSNLYSVAWRQGQKYETRIAAIKKNPTDSIFWSFGPEDPIWFGINITPLRSCQIISSYESVQENGQCQRTYEDIFINNQTGINETQVHYRNYTCETGSHINIANNSVCRTEGFKIGKYTLNYSKCNINCGRDGKIFQCVECDDGGGPGCLNYVVHSGQAGVVVDLTSPNWKSELQQFRPDTSSMKKRLRECVEIEQD